MTGYKGGKEHKKDLENRRLINCGRCKYHRTENYTRRPRTDSYKSYRRIARSLDVSAE